VYYGIIKVIELTVVQITVTENLRRLCSVAFPVAFG